VRVYENWIAGAVRPANQKVFVASPWSGRTVAEVEFAEPADLELALTTAFDARALLRKTTRSQRAEFLNAIADALEERRELFVKILIEEAGKPIDLADVEVTRAVSTFRIAAAEVRGFVGRKIALDSWGNSARLHDGFTVWEPRGVVLGITPFNFPLNLVAHKVAPAIAAGCPIIVKPAPKAPGGAHVLCAEIGALASRNEFKAFVHAVQCVSQTNELTSVANADPRVAVLSFTGNDVVGWALKTQAPARRHATLELGGNAAVVIDLSADLDFAAERVAWGAFSFAGQSCISVQRVYVLDGVYDRFTEKLLAATRQIAVGDPAKRGVLAGPVIDDASATRLTEKINAAVTGGAKILIGGEAQAICKRCFEPIVITNTKPSDAVVRDEIFGPLVCVERVKSLDAGIAAVNNSRFGLQAGIFTDSCQNAKRFADEVEVGGVIVGDIPTLRFDAMPYGGLKDSGVGREGLRSAMEDYSDLKVIVQSV